MSRFTCMRRSTRLVSILALCALSLAGRSAPAAQADGSGQLPVAAASPVPAPQIVPANRNIVVKLNTSSPLWTNVRQQFQQGHFGLRLAWGSHVQWFVPAGSGIATGSLSVSNAISYNATTATVTVQPGTLNLNTLYKPTLAVKDSLQALLTQDLGGASASPTLCCSYSWSFQTANVATSSSTTITSGSGSTPLSNGGTASLTAMGSGSVVLASYSSNPITSTASPLVFPARTGFLDLSTSIGSAISSLTLTVTGANVLYWWTGTAWQKASPQSSSGNSATVTVTNSSSPSLSQLNGTPLAGVPAPVITSVSPNTGQSSGGNAIKITGTGFSGATAVQIGGATVQPISGQTSPAFTVISDTTIEVWSTPAGSGTVDARVTTAGGTNTASSADWFTYGSAPPQTVAIPAYIPPDTQPADWNRIDSGASTVGLAVINPDNGPGTSCNTAYTQQIQTSQAHGIAVLGYVYTKYANTVIDPLVTPNAYDRTVANVEADINQYYSCYPTLDGIFFDEGSTDCSYVSTYYAPLSAYVKSKGGKAITVINPGTQTNECYMGAADILVTFEGQYSDYTSYTPSAWTANYPAGRFWNLVYNAPDLGSMQDAVSRSKTNRAGWFYATNVSPNLWGATPSDPYWTDELLAVRPATPTITSVAPNNGPPAGGTPVTINGANFSRVSQVCFGGTCLSTGFTVNAARTQIAVTSPAGTAGTVGITITTANGTSATRSADQFSYANPPSSGGNLLTNGDFSQGISGWTPNCKSWSGQGYTEGSGCGTFYTTSSSGIQLTGYGGAGDPYNGVYQIVPATSSSVLTGTVTVNSMSECADGSIAVSVTLLDSSKNALGPTLNGDPMYGNIVFGHHPYYSTCTPYINASDTTAYYQDMPSWTAASGPQQFSMDIGSIITQDLSGINASQVAYVKVQLTDYADITSPVVTFGSLSLSPTYPPGTVNVKDAPYNAQGDGTTDDTSAFTSALSHLDSAGGGTLYVPPGTYLVQPSTLNVHSNVTIVGLGATLKPSVSGYDLLDITGSNVTLSNITLDGNDSVPRGLNVNPGSSHVTLSHDVVLNLRQSSDPSTGSLYNGAPVGIQIYDNVDTVLIDGTTVDNVVADHIESSSPGHRVARGIRISPNTGQPIATNVTIQNSSLSNVGPKDDGDCIVLQGDPTATYQASLTIFNNNFIRCHKRAIKIQVAGAAISNNTIVNSFNGDNYTDPQIADYTASAFPYDMYAAISVYNSNVSVTGNTITGSGSFYNGIELGTDCTTPYSNVTVSNNTVHMGPTPPVAGSSLIRTMGAVNNLTIANNTLDNADYGFWLVNGLTGTSISGNTITNVVSYHQTVYNGC